MNRIDINYESSDQRVIGPASIVWSVTGVIQNCVASVKKTFCDFFFFLNQKYFYSYVGTSSGNDAKHEMATV